MPQSLRKHLVAWFAARFCSSARIEDSERDTDSTTRPVEEDLDETAYRREVEAMPEQLRLAIFLFIHKHIRRSDGRLNEQVFGRRLLGDRVWPLIEDLPLTSVNLAVMDQLFGSLEAPTRSDMTGRLLEGLLEWGPADSITHLDVLTSAPDDLDCTNATFGCLNCHNFPSVTSLNLSGRLSEAEEVFTETVMETLVEWEGLQSLTLRDCTFPESAAPLISQLTSLQKLALGSDEQSAGYPTTYRVYKSILESVAGLTQLEELRLCNCDELTRDTLARILQFENLTKLDLSLSPLWSPGSIEKPNTSLTWLKITPSATEVGTAINDIARLFPSLFTLGISVDCLPDDFASLGAELPSVRTLAVTTAKEDTVTRLLSIMPNVEQVTLKRLPLEEGQECSVEFVPGDLAQQITSLQLSAGSRGTRWLPVTAGPSFLSQFVSLRTLRIEKEFGVSDVASLAGCFPLLEELTLAAGVQPDPAYAQATKAAFPRLRKCTVLCTRDTQGAESYKAVW